MSSKYNQETKKFIITELQTLYPTASYILLENKSYLSKRDGKNLLLKEDHFELDHFIKKLEIYPELTGRVFSPETKSKLQKVIKFAPKEKDRKLFDEIPIKDAFTEFIQTFDIEDDVEVKSETESEVSRKNTPTKEISFVDDFWAKLAEVVEMSDEIDDDQVPEDDEILKNLLGSLKNINLLLSQRNIESSLQSNSPINNKTLSPTIEENTTPNKISNLLAISPHKSPKKSPSNDLYDFLLPKKAVEQKQNEITRLLFQSHDPKILDGFQNTTKIWEELNLHSSSLKDLWNGFFQFLNYLKDDYSLKVATFNLYRFTVEKAQNILKSESRDLFLNIFKCFDVIAVQEVEGGSGDEHPGLGELCVALGYEYYCQSQGNQREAFIVNPKVVEVSDVYDWTQTKMLHKPLEIKFKCLKNNNIYSFISVHIQPSNRISEMSTILSGLREKKLENNVTYIILGDINYEFGSNVAELDKLIDGTSQSWKWMNDKSINTTPSDKVYDAILCLDKCVPDKYVSGVYKFPSEGLFENLKKGPKFSDHYPVYWLVK